MERAHIDATRQPWAHSHTETYTQPHRHTVFFWNSTQIRTPNRAEPPPTQSKTPFLTTLFVGLVWLEGGLGVVEGNRMRSAGRTRFFCATDHQIACSCFRTRLSKILSVTLPLLLYTSRSANARGWFLFLFCYRICYFPTYAIFDTHSFALTLSLSLAHPFSRSQNRTYNMYT